MKEFLFDVTLNAAIRVKANSQAEAEAKILEHLECADVNAGCWEDDGEPITFEASVAGELSLAEVDGEAV